MEEKTYSRKIANAVSRFLKEDDWHFSFDDKKGLFKFGLRLEGKLQKIDYLIDIRDKEYIVYAYCPLRADKEDSEAMASMAEFICRANYGLKKGNFEFDMRDGEIRFKSFVGCYGIIPTQDMVKQSIYCAAEMFEMYGDGIADIIVGGFSAKEAADRCEKNWQFKFLSALADSRAEDESLIDRLQALASAGENGEDLPEEKIASFGSDDTDDDDLDDDDLDDDDLDDDLDDDDLDDDLDDEFMARIEAFLKATKDEESGSEEETGSEETGDDTESIRMDLFSEDGGAAE